MNRDPLARLAAAIADLARERDLALKRSRDALAAQERQRIQWKAAWQSVMSELPGLVIRIHDLLKGDGYAALVLSKYDLKHADIGRALVEFEHNERNHSKIILFATWEGDLCCSIRFVTGEVPVARMRMAELTDDSLKEIMGEAVTKCLSSEVLPRTELAIHTEDATS